MVAQKGMRIETPAAVNQETPLGTCLCADEPVLGADPRLVHHTSRRISTPSMTKCAPSQQRPDKGAQAKEQPVSKRNHIRKERQPTWIRSNPR